MTTTPQQHVLDLADKVLEAHERHPDIEFYRGGFVRENEETGEVKMCPIALLYYDKVGDTDFVLGADMIRKVIEAYNIDPYICMPNIAGYRKSIPSVVMNVADHMRVPSFTDFVLELRRIAEDAQFCQENMIVRDGYYDVNDEGDYDD